jgi:aldehyde dehydrogenase
MAPGGKINAERVRALAADVLARVNVPPPAQRQVATGSTPPARISAAPNAEPAAVTSAEPVADQDGVFGTVASAVAAARSAQRELSARGIAAREAATECIREICRTQAEELGTLEFEETRIGRLAHKIEKLSLVATVPGVEMLRSEAVSGDRGLTVTEFAPFGVIGAITPVTHSIPTLVSNAIMMIAAGNTVVCNPHPGGARCLCEAVRRWNRAIHARLGIANLVCVLAQPTLETAQEIFAHPDIALLCVTGGPGLARAAMASPKRAIVAGPGNPPVVVDETADIAAAAEGILQGAAYDNNLLCIGEKEVFVVEPVADELLAALGRCGGYRLSRTQMNALAEKCIARSEDTGHYHTRKAYIGQDPQVLAATIDIEIPQSVRLLYGVTAAEHPLVACEQMMPVLPIVRVADVDTAIDLAVKYEHGFRHTAIMWSRDVDRLTRMGRACAATLFVKNGPSTAGLGVGGEGYLSFSTASPTGEGVTSPLTFTRYRRCIMVDRLRVV